MSDPRAVSSWRTLPFNEHRSFAEVIETEQLEARRVRGDLVNGEFVRLISLQSRATLPDSMTREPDTAA